MFELSYLTIDEQVYRQDYYSTKTNFLSWKEDCDKLPEFDIDYKHTEAHTIIEYKPFINELGKMD